MKSPIVFFSDFAWAQLWNIVDICEKEVGWFGLVEELEGGNYMIEELFVPEQEVSGTTTDIEPEDLAKLVEQLESEGKDSSKLRYWGHSHVNMDVRPSGTDEDQIEEYLDHCEWFIRGIHNKKRSSKVDVYNVEAGLVHQCVENGRYMPPLSAEDYAMLKTTIELNVKSKIYGYAPNGNYHGNQRWGHQGGRQVSTPGKPASGQGNVRPNDKEPGKDVVPSERANDDEWGDDLLSFLQGGTEDESLPAQRVMDAILHRFLYEDLDFMEAFINPFRYVKQGLHNAGADS